MGADRDRCADLRGLLPGPILVATGLAGGRAALLTWSWLQPLGFALIVASVAGLAWSRHCRRGTTTGCGTVGAGCGCTT
ncbi:hypothetical protein [Nocardia sp. Marseille-Q1738]